MSDILKQIQALQEQFSNLFEVEGLGNPAVDVPPSQNKIKKDVKTKDGKAELVSVEDELFPYDGNKREQYRQKILDTINGMIQGTSTLEDLLQIVRQKKAPLKEAMELMENIYSQIKKIHGKPDTEYHYYPLEPGEPYDPEEHGVGTPKKNKSAELTDKAAEIQYNEVKGAAKREGKSEQEIENKRKETKRTKGKYIDPYNSEALEEAIEVLESLLSEGKNLNAVIDRAKKGSYEQRKVLQNKYGEEADWTEDLKHPDVSIENIRKKEGKEAAGAEVLKGLSASIPDSKTYKVNKRSKGAKNIFSKTNFTDTTDTNIGNVDSTLLGDYVSDKRQTNKAIGRHYRKLAKLKEAMELMENIYSQIKKVHGEDFYNPMNKSAKLITKASDLFNKEVADSSKREGRDTREKRINARAHNGEWTTNHGGVWSNRANDYEGTHDPEATEKSIARHFDKVLYKPLKKQANITRKAVATEKFKRMNSEALKEAVEILEGMINELYPDTVKSALHAHNKKTIELEDKVNKRIGEIFKKHGIKGNTYSAATAEDRQKAAETEKEIKEDPEIKDLHNQQEKRAKKNELYRNAIRKARKSPVEEALEIMEAIINEVSDKTAQGALDAAQQRYNRKGYEASMKLFQGDSKGAIEDGNKAQDEYNKHLGLQLKRAKRLGKKLVQDKNDHDSFKIKEALSLMEAIINEVSMDKWKEAAVSSFPKRQEKALTLSRKVKASSVAAADPVKSRNEAD